MLLKKIISKKFELDLIIPNRMPHISPLVYPASEIVNFLIVSLCLRYVSDFGQEFQPVFFILGWGEGVYEEKIGSVFI